MKIVVINSNGVSIQVDVRNQEIKNNENLGLKEIRIEGFYDGKIHDPRSKYVKTKVEDLSPKRMRYLRDLIDPKLLGPCGGIIAGGALRNLMNEDEEIKDIDIFFITDNSSVVMRDFSDEMNQGIEQDSNGALRCGHYNLVFIPTKNVPDPSIEAQVTRILNDFDFNVCRWAYDGTYIYWNRKFAKETKKKRVYIQKMGKLGKLVPRLEKYRTKGYDISDAFKFYEKVIPNKSLIEYEAK